MNSRTLTVAAMVHAQIFVTRGKASVVGSPIIRQLLPTIQLVRIYNPHVPTAGGCGNLPPALVNMRPPLLLTSWATAFILPVSREFQFDPNGAKNQTAWTAGGSDGNAFLVLDRNNDGVIDDGSELFGNFTPQPSSAHPNGFLALAQFDKPENGGNGDGVIDQRDLMFARLRLWVDVNHDGISQPEELHTLPELGIFSISLHYIEMMKEDEFGNTFRYRADVNSNPKDGRPRWAYDVFLASENSGSSGRQQSSPVHCRAEVRRARAAVGRPFSLDDSHDIWLDVTGTAKSLTGNR